MTKPILIDLHQRSQEWREWKKGKIGSTYAACIMGQDPYQTKAMLWDKMVFDLETPVNAAMQRGMDYEQEALDWVNYCFESFGIQFSPVCFQHEKYEDIITSIDGWNGEEFVEIKIPMHYVPHMRREYYPQNQHHFMVSGAKSGYHVVYSPERKEGVIIPVCRDEEYIHKLLKKELEFLDSIINFRPPIGEKNKLVNTIRFEVNKNAMV